jgi:hypothetical protein
LLAFLALLLIAGVFAWFAAGRQFLTDEPPLPIWDEDPWSDRTMAVLWVVFGLVLPACYFLVRMVTEVRGRALVVGMRPLRPSVYDVSTVRQVQVVSLTDEEVARSFRSKRLAHSAGGTVGVVVTLEDGRNVFVESKQPEDLSAAIYRAR